MPQLLYVNEEPDLSELFSDPIMHALLKCDGLTAQDVKKVIREYQSSRTSAPRS